MNKRRLRHDASVLPASLLDRVKEQRVYARTVKPNGVRITTRQGSRYVLPMIGGHGPIGDGVPVYVWWTGSDLMCASVADVDAAEVRLADVGEQVKRAREHLAKARAARSQPAGLRRDSMLATEPIA